MAAHTVKVTVEVVLELEEGANRSPREVGASVQYDLTRIGQTLYAVRGAGSSSNYRLTDAAVISARAVKKES